MALSKTLLAKLKNPSLATDKALIAGEWQTSGETGATFDVSNPSTGEVIASLPDMTRADAARAIDAAHTAQ
ncbi:aldehyde dehydrogenase family protein, partial [Neorhizobium alkalisoli]|uniref:aldehyde dehydrogenase family protein n=1 Tax=Neorhizobium alkalisoli TaxID=528178 RepID=UPI001319D0AD